MKAPDFDKKFDEGEDATNMLDLSRARRRGLEAKRVNVDFPAWMVQSLDREARKLGVTRHRSSRCGWRTGWHANQLLDKTWANRGRLLTLEELQRKMAGWT
jgi:hypothetical protein